MRDRWDKIKCTNISIIGIPEKERENYIFDEIMAINFPNLKKETYQGTVNTDGIK